MIYYFCFVGRFHQEIIYKNDYDMKMASLCYLCVFSFRSWASFGRVWIWFDLFYMTMKIDLSMIFVMRQFTSTFVIIRSSLYILLLLLYIITYGLVGQFSSHLSKDPSFLTTIKRCTSIFLCYYQLLSNSLWSLKFVHPRILLAIKME